MSIPGDISWQFRGSEAFFAYVLHGAQRLGGRFDEYEKLAESITVAAGKKDDAPPRDNLDRAAERADIGPAKFHCGEIVKRVRGQPAVAVLTESQTSVLSWIFAPSEPRFIDSIVEMVHACYSEKKPEGWWDLREAPPGHGVRRDCGFYGGIPPAPMIPRGYTIEDFICVSDIYVNAHALMFGVRVKVAWSRGQIGLQYQGKRNKKTGDVLFRCIGVGPGDLVIT